MTETARESRADGVRPAPALTPTLSQMEREIQNALPPRLLGGIVVVARQPDGTDAAATLGAGSRAAGPASAATALGAGLALRAAARG
jgi:hypothetical protein